MTGTAEAPRSRLYDRTFLFLCLAGFLGVAQNYAVQPIVPLAVLALGGDATLAGVVVALFSLPSIAARPFIGRLVDVHGPRRVEQGGTLGLGLAGFAYLVPSLPAFGATRILHGLGWGAFNLGAFSMVARLAPAARRGEASAAYSLVINTAQTLLPAVGLSLLPHTGFTGPFVLSGALGLAAAAALVGTKAVPRPAGPPPAGSWRALLERDAMGPAGIQLFYLSVQSLFIVYVPLFALAHGQPAEAYAAYYPAYGIVFLVGTALAARWIDRLGRGRSLGAGVVLGLAGCTAGIRASDLVTLAVAGAIYAVGSALVQPTAFAMAIDRADPSRLGAAMATYTLSYQVAAGAGAPVWGWCISTFGFPAPFVGGALVLAALAAWLRTAAGARALGGGPGRRAARTPAGEPPG